MKEMLDMELSYFAGVFDGDGSFSLCKKTEKEGRSPLYYPLIQLSTTNYILIDMLLDIFGGSVNTRKAYLDKKNIQRKESKRWKLEKRNQCTPFLEKIVDFLILKQERARFLLDFIKSNPFKRGSKPIDIKVLKDRESAYLKMRAFNSVKVKPVLKIPKKRINTKNPIFWNYLAGLMDTDGSFSLKRENMVKYAPVISLSMIHSKSLNKIISNCSYGNIFIINANTARSGFCYRYYIGAIDECMAFLENIIPYLRLKKKQAKILYEYCLQKKQNKRIDAINCENYYKKIIEANNGVYKPSLIDSETVTDRADGDGAEGVSHRERLSERAHKGCDSLNSRGNLERRIRRGLPA